ncbi:MAG: (Fe-S)-binding protein [Deltaproteobacteria bacterium]|nr:(Fe-S)-binding protein [Deltaproteobacteria bacterium]
MSNPPTKTYPARPDVVYFYGTCLSDLFYPEAGLAAVVLLEAQGVRVKFPKGQTCCGQPAFNSGYREEARKVALAQMRLFPEPWPVVVPSGSCGAMMRLHYPSLFFGTPQADFARSFATRVFEWSEFMVQVLQVQLKDRGPAVTVAYHPSCHLVRELGVVEEPLILLRQLAGVRLVSLDDAQDCCGFGGSFSIKMPAISSAMAADKCAAVARSGAEVLVSMDNGCLMNLGGSLKKAGVTVHTEPLPLFLRSRVLD